MNTPWWREPFRTLQTNLREIDADLDVDAELDTIQAYGANVWLLSVGGIIANYPSRLACQRVNPTLAGRASGDLVGDAVAAASERGIRVLGRMDFSKIDAQLAEQHPHWCFVDEAGKQQVYNGYVSVCPNAGYYQRETFDVISEVLERYDLAGFFFNWLSFNETDYSRRYWGVCHCEACHAAFREYAPDVDLPVDPSSPGYRTWRAFTSGVIDDFTARMRAHVHASKEDAALILGDRADITFHEANNAVGRPLWHHATAEAVSAARSAEPDRPVFVNAVGFLDMPYRWAGEDPNHFAQYLLQAIAHGAAPSTYVMGPAAEGRYRALELGGQITRFHRDNADVYAGLGSSARVALVRGTYSRDAQDAPRTAEFQGCYLALCERHVPFDVVRLDRLDDLAPDRYALVVLPHLGALSSEEVTALETVLDSGGAVVTTGDSAWSAGALQLGGEYPLAERRAVYADEESVRSLHLSLGEGEGDLAPVVGEFHVLRPAERAFTGWHALGRSRYGPPEQCYGHRPTPHPGWVSGSVGSGRLGLLPWCPGLVYRELGLKRVADAFVDRLLELGGDHLRLDTDLPAAVRVVPGQARGRTILHLLNRSGDAPQRFLEPLPIGPGRLRLPASAEPVAVRARVAGTDLDWRLRGGDLELTLPGLGRFEVVEVQWNTARRVILTDNPT